MEQEKAMTLPQWARVALRPHGHVPAPHHMMLLKQLSQMSLGRVQRLMVLMPPGSGKSVYSSVLFPVWWLLRHHKASVLAASHTAELARHFGRQGRNLIAEHKALLGYGLAGDNRAAHRFQTTVGGEYFAAGLGGPITGRRADLVVIDDPIKSHAEADSSTHREFVWDWYRSELVTRLKPKGRIALIMTRWHQDDLGGRLLASGEDWTVLRLPAIAEDNDPMQRVSGAALWPTWEDAEALERKRVVVGPRVWNALYQQAPVPDGGVLFAPERIGTMAAAPAGLRCVRAWDLAATAAADGRDPDWTAGLKLGRDEGGRVFILDVVRFRGGPHAVAQAIVNTAALDGKSVAVGLPQDPGQAGKQQVAWLAGMLAGYRVVSSPETGAKVTRASPIAAQVDAGNVVMLRAAWNAVFLDELRSFPQGRKDDQVDALARAYGMLSVTAAVPARVLSFDMMAR